MALYLVERAAGAGVRKADQMVISATNLADAKAFCNSQFGSESQDWASACGSPTMAAALVCWPMF